MTDNLVGTQLGKYKIQAEIGRGGMGTVYKGYDSLLERYVAVKVLAPHLVWENEFVERFLREARAAARLKHPHIAIIHDVGQEGNSYYFVMEYLEGQTLAKIIRQGGPLPPREVLHILSSLAEALDYAHSQGLVHRDIKSGNVIVNQAGQATLTDFGIARAAQETRLTKTGVLMGTPEYMSPEQAQGEEVDHHTDIYSLGIVVYEMLTGRVPFSGSTPHVVLHQQIYNPPPPVRAAGPMETVLLKALAKQAGDRYATAGDFARAFDEAVILVETEWLRQQVAEVAAWIDEGRYDEALDRLETLTQAHPGDREVATKLTEARQQVHLASLYAEVQRLWTQAQAKAEEILTAAPRYADPDGLLRSLRGRKLVIGRQPAAPVAEGEWPRWLNPVSLAVVTIGSLAGVILHRPNVEWGVNLGIWFLFVLLAALSTWHRITLRTRRGLAIFNLALVLYTVSLTEAIIPRPYWLGTFEGIQGVWYILQFGILLGSAMIFWTLFVRRQDGLPNALVALGSLIVILSYATEWVWMPWLPWDRGYELVYQKDYPSWVGIAVAFLPAISLLSSMLLCPADDPDPLRRRKRALWSIILAGSALVGMMVVGLVGVRLQQPGDHPAFYGRPYLGVWLVLTGLALVLLGVVIRAVPVLRPTKAEGRDRDQSSDRA